MNLFDKYDELITPGVLANLSLRVNDTTGNTDKALRGTFYTLVACLIRKCTSSMGVNMLHSQIQRSGEAGNLAYKVDSVTFDPDTFQQKLNHGNKLLSLIFPSYKSPVINMITTYAEVPKPPTTDYVKFATAFITDLLDDKIKTDKLTPEGLGAFVLSHQPDLFGRSPEGLLETMIPALGLQELTSARPPASGKQGREAEREVAYTESPSYDINDIHEPRRSVWPYILGALLLIGLGAGGWWYYTYQYLPQQAALAEQVEETNTIDSLAIQPDTNAVAAVDSSGADPAAGNQAVSDLSRSLTSYLADTTQAVGKEFELDKLSFVAGTTQPDSASVMAVANDVADLLTKYPKMQIRVQGYDIDGTKAYAFKRAQAFKAELLKRGVDNNRIDAVGFQIIGKNKVAVKVVKK